MARWPRGDKPLTGNGRTTEPSRKPKNSELRMMSVYSEGEVGVRRKQPSGWGIADIIKLYRGRHRQ